MPLETPNPNETKNQFISRFMSDPDMMREFPNFRQRYAVAVEKWDNRIN